METFPYAVALTFTFQMDLDNFRAGIEAIMHEADLDQAQETESLPRGLSFSLSLSLSLTLSFSPPSLSPGSTRVKPSP